jgi:hypothetical protein
VARQTVCGQQSGKEKSDVATYRVSALAVDKLTLQVDAQKRLF